MEKSFLDGQEKNKIIIVDNTDGMENEVRDVADANLAASKEELKGVKGFCKKIWKYGLAQSYYRNKEIYKVRQEIVASDDLYAQEGGDRTTHMKVMNDIVNRFASEYDEAVHKEDAGEKKEVMGNRISEHEIKNKIRNLIEKYADPETALSDADFYEEKKVIFSELKEARRDVIDKGIMFADNLLEVAKNFKESAGHVQKTKELDLDFDVIIGKAKSGVRTEAQFDAVDRITEKIASSRMGSFVNEATIASAVGMSYCIGTFVSKKVLDSKLAAWGTFGATAGLTTIFSGMRESRKLEDERKQHAREIAKGKKFNPDRSPQRKEMEEFRHETREANVLVDALEDGLYDVVDGKRELKKINRDRFKKSLSDLVEIESRVRISDQQKVDLISYSDARNVEAERLRMDVARATAKIELRRIAKNDADFLPRGRNFDDVLQIVQEARTRQIIEGDNGMEKKNELFKKIKDKKVKKAMFNGLLVGLSFGAIGQEIGSFFQGRQDGLLSARSVFDSNDAVQADQHHYTVIEYLRRLVKGDFPEAQKLGLMHEIVAGGHRIHMPGGTDLSPNPDGSFSLTRGGIPMADHITFNPEGGLSDESLRLLERRGIDAGTFGIPPSDGASPVAGNPVTIFSVPQAAPSEHVVDAPMFVPYFGRSPLEKNEKDVPNIFSIKNEEEIQRIARASSEINGILIEKNKALDGAIAKAEAALRNSLGPGLKDVSPEIFVTTDNTDAKSDIVPGKKVSENMPVLPQEPQMQPQPSSASEKPLDAEEGKKKMIDDSVERLSDSFSGLRFSYDEMIGEAEKNRLSVAEMAYKFIYQGNTGLRSQFDAQLNMIPYEQWSKKMIEKLALSIIFEDEKTKIEEFIEENTLQMNLNDQAIISTTDNEERRLLEMERKIMENGRVILLEKERKIITFLKKMQSE